MKQEKSDAKDGRQANGRSIIDIETLVERVWMDMQGSVPRTVIEPEISRILKKYENVRVKLYVPILVQREARESFR